MRTCKNIKMNVDVANKGFGWAFIDRDLGVLKKS